MTLLSLCARPSEPAGVHGLPARCTVNDALRPPRHDLRGTLDGLALLTVKRIPTVFLQRAIDRSRRSTLIMRPSPFFAALDETNSARRRKNLQAPYIHPKSD
jgi:hypothetical protein